MRKHLSFGMALAVSGLCAVLAPQLYADDITAVEENGRRVFVNSEANPRPTPSQASSSPQNTQPARILMYWSSAERRWKRVKPATPAAVRDARWAAADVRRYVANRPRQGKAAEAALPPDVAPMARGYRVTSKEIDAAIQRAATAHGVDANLVRAMIQVESNFNPQAISHKGAMGLMQLMPATARSLNVRNPFDPEQNIEGGVRHFAGLLNSFGGNVELSLAAYNAGSGAVQRNRGVPPYRETRNYVKKITELYGSGQATTAPRDGSAAPIRVQQADDGRVIFTNVD